MWYGCASILVAVLTTTAAPGPEAATNEQATVTIIGSPPLLTNGTRCEIEMKPEPGSNPRRRWILVGRIRRANDDEISLTLEREKTVLMVNSPLAGISVFTQPTRSIRIRQAEPKEWFSIPVEMIQSVRCLGPAAEPISSTRGDWQHLAR